MSDLPPPEENQEEFRRSVSPASSLDSGIGPGPLVSGLNIPSHVERDLEANTERPRSPRRDSRSPSKSNWNGDNGGAIKENGFCILDDGQHVNACVEMELTLLPFQVTKGTLPRLPCGLKESNRKDLMSAFEPWNKYVSNTDDVSMVKYHPLDDKTPRVLTLSAFLMISLGYYIASNEEWTVSYIMYTAGVFLLGAVSIYMLARVKYARVAFRALYKEVEALAGRLQSILGPDGIEIRPVGAERSHCCCWQTAHFRLDMTVPVWTRGSRTTTTSEEDRTCDSPVCPICLEEFQESQVLRVLACSHQYHAACADGWLKNSTLCPLCKQATGSDKRCTFVA
eukprot:gnl/TRDRNA2_/TRDRNA2_60250_c0_seq1.p1 gnl/TRDRNA2_/TRDRNA2_60250_c0~~gnl/TRDRNA2_/TRDRNA2_60250_c0_seq1.p1  ORF type:complete len:339 (+),score=30.87 gnl/TRDRNA2_/TRDRNA2_60250_c0_seq1:84-1100(+)